MVADLISVDFPRAMRNPLDFQKLSLAP